MIKVIGVGDNTVDTYLHKRMKFPGGNAVNVAVLAHRYGHPAAYLGWLGDDERGALIMTALQQEGIDVSRCRVVASAPTAYSEVSLVEGDRVFGESLAGATELIRLEAEDFAYIADFDLVHTSVYSHLEEQVAELKAAAGCLSFDFSQQLDQAYLEQILPHVDIAFFSLADVSAGDMDALMRRASALGPRLLVMTRGKDGAWVYDGQALYHQSVRPVEAIDTLGAGDAFAARFLVEYLDGCDIPTAMERAAQSAAENCTWYGAFGHGVSY